jgi:hypothetical protein
MFTRSQLFKVEIDFEESSKEWLKNKQKLDNGTYKYICDKVMKNNKICNRLNCKIHSFKNKNI